MLAPPTGAGTMKHACTGRGSADGRRPGPTGCVPDQGRRPLTTARWGPALVVAVHAPAVDGRATEAARRALAEALGVRPARVALRSGATSRDKLFTVTAPPADLDRRLRALRDGQ